jgi:hypothetical protein
MVIEPGSPLPQTNAASFDFGTSDSPLEDGYTRISQSTPYSASLGYGWSITSGLDSRDRGGSDVLNRDFVFGSGDHTFNVDLADGDYEVTVVVGDQSFGHDLINVYAEGSLEIDDLTIPAGVFYERVFWVSVVDGQLNLLVHDDGGADSNWVLNSLTIELGSPPPPQTEVLFDFGTVGSPVEFGYTQVTAYTLYSAGLGYGWGRVSGLDSRDRGGPDDLRRDFVFGSVDRTFNVDLANGDYIINATIGDQNFMHDGIDVYIEDALLIDDLTVAAGTFYQVSLVVTVADGQLNLRILDDGGDDVNWVLNAVTVESDSLPAT